MTEGGELPELAADEPPADEQALARIEHAERVADLRTLKPREHHTLYRLGVSLRRTRASRRWA